jgi:hypothetical protein
MNVDGRRFLSVTSVPYGDLYTASGTLKSFLGHSFYHDRPC